MTEHNHATFVQGCFRCELSVDEMKDQMTDKATVILFKPSGKYYTEEEWDKPEKVVGPYSMDNSPDFRRIDGGPVLIPTQEPWGYPHLL